MYAFNSAAIFYPGHPYIESTTVLSDYTGAIYDKPDRSTVGVFLVGVHVMSRCDGCGLFSKEEVGLLVDLITVDFKKD